jgi:membrane protease YdiL (CAAX protease family)
MTVRLSSPALAWSAYLVVSLILLMFIAGPVYPVAVGALAVGVALITVRQPVRWSPAPRDIAILVALYAACVAAFYIAFQVVTTGSEILLFVVFGAGLLVGVIGPLAHVVMVQRRPLADLGLRRDRLPQTLALGLLLAAVQVAVVLPLVRFGTPDTWLPLAALALMVGLYEAVFFRAYVLAILEPMIGVAPAVAVASGLYALYHVGYGMAAEEMVFLAGLGLVYTVAYAAVRNVLVLWPILTPFGSFFANVRAGDIELPMIAILGFVDIVALMLAAIWLVRRWSRRRANHAPRSGPADSHSDAHSDASGERRIGTESAHAPTDVAS